MRKTYIFVLSFILLSVGIQARGPAIALHSFLVEPVRRAPPAYIPDGYLSTGLYMADYELTEVYGYFLAPPGACDLVASPVLVPSSPGIMLGIVNATWGGPGEVYNANYISNSPTPVGLSTGLGYNVVMPLAIGSGAGGDFVSLEFARYGADPVDNIGGYVYFVGWLVTYSDGCK